ncbi:DUF3019 domain-containing protein [Thalassotalea fonticola]|uniref:DUF3019 domain-containing protein n=1 Tax=Thalassotalea fonticola TaxID=3065649 RepID=A0ABZ0GLZ5_9GAMM|nr:DUF3019 domain-containing protein [Colwelliaceae bacterium S1-1]
MLTLNTNKIYSLIPYLKLAVFLCIACCFTSVSANADGTQDNKAQLAQLKVTPKRCIALRKGQKCYLEVTFSWRHPKVGDYCLVNITTIKTIKCWQQQAKGELNFDFQSTLSNDFALRKQQSETDLARARIPVAWVYKSSKRAKSTWRLF